MNFVSGIVQILTRSFLSLSTTDMTVLDNNQPESDLSSSRSSTIASEIPLDVLDVIFRNLNPQDLSTWCRVNKAVFSLAFEALYRNLHPTRRNLMPLCLKLCNDSNLALLVRSFTIYDNSVEMYFGIIQDTLLLLPRLHTLNLFIGQYGSWVLPRQKPCPFTLQAFSSSFFCDQDMISFLDSQPEVKRLTISGPIYAAALQAITSRTIPHLTSIHAPLSVVEVLAPNRPIDVVTTFCTSGPDQSTTPSISCLSRTTSPFGVQRLILNFVYLRNIGCKQIAQAVPRLLFFRIDADDVKPDDNEVCTRALRAVQHLTSGCLLDDR